jgi:small subunit ribosomal protein S20
MRTSDEDRQANRATISTMKKSIKEIKAVTKKADADSKLQDVFSNIDKAAKKKIIHKNKAANMKSRLAKRVNALSE